MEEKIITWDEAYKDSKPLISYSILLGIDMLQVKNLVIEILENSGDIYDRLLEIKEISRMPVIDRHDYEFPTNIHDFVFYDKARLLSTK